MTRAIAIGLIDVYQKHISPHKGYCCAYRHRHGGRSCSAYAKRALRLTRGAAILPLMRRRFRKCAAAAKAQEERRHPPATGARPLPDTATSPAECACAMEGCTTVGCCLPMNLCSPP